METSAKNATNVEQAFMAMAAEIKNRYSVLLVAFSLFKMGSKSDIEMSRLSKGCFHI